MNYQKFLDNKVSSLKGKTIVITGANSGIGFSLARQAAYKGANVVLACRNEERANKAIAVIKTEVKNASVSFMSYDQASFASIDNFANGLTKFKEIDCLVLNAGVFKPGKDLKTKDNFPLTTGTNYVGAFYLINKLENVLSKGIIKHVLIVSSFARLFAPSNYLDYLRDDKNKLWKAYFSSKRMNYELAFFLKEKYPNIAVNIMHPGIATTRIVDNELYSFSKFLVAIGNVVLKVIANSSDKSALGMSLAISENNKDNINYYFPRRIFHTAGMPSHKKLNINKIKNTELISVSYSLIKD